MGKRIIVLSFLAVTLGVISGCGKEEPKPAGSGQTETPVFVKSIVSVERRNDAAGTEALLVPAGAVFQDGQLSGVHVVDKEGRVSVRWVRTGRPENGFLVILGGLDAGEKVVGSYEKRLEEGVQVKQQASVPQVLETKEVQSNE